MRESVDNPRWWRSSEHSILAGVCEGLGEKLDIGPWIIRLLWLSTVLFLGTGLLLYVFAAIAFPKKHRLHERDKMVLGVCANISRRLDMAPEIVRFACLVLSMASIGATAVIYLILAYTLPKPQSEY
jgi:phage shock protein C